MEKEMTRKELIDRIASDYGHGPAVTEQFSTELLRRAFYSSIGTCNYVTTLLKMKHINSYKSINYFMTAKID